VRLSFFIGIPWRRLVQSSTNIVKKFVSRSTYPLFSCFQQYLFHVHLSPLLHFSTCNQPPFTFSHIISKRRPSLINISSHLHNPISHFILYQQVLEKTQR
jgi:hypothetical protein